MWFLDLFSQCHRHDIPFHFKQWGEWAPIAGHDALPCVVLQGEGFSAPLVRFGLEPDFGATSVTYKLAELLARADAPIWREAW